MTAEQKILPSADEKRYVEEVKRKIADNLAKCLVEQPFDLQFAGSTELGTFVSEDYDVDAFVVTDKKAQAFEKIRKHFPGAQKKGELLIWHTVEDDTDTDIVVVSPEDPKTQTLEHTEHYKKVLSEKDKKEVIKAKALMKGRGCYSAELGGITGVALTELIAKHKSLNESCDVLEKNEKQHLADPTSPERNLLASVNPTRWQCIKDACREYRETGQLPQERYTDETFLQERRSEKFHVLPLKRQNDTAIDFSRGFSACQRCANELKNYEKDIEKTECDAYVGSKTLVAYKAPEQLSSTTERKVPLTAPAEALDAFRKAHPEAREKDDHLVATVKRKVTEPKKWMKKCVVTRYVRK